MPSSAAARRRLLPFRSSASVIWTRSASSLDAASVDRVKMAELQGDGRAGTRNASGRSSIWIVGPAERATARSMTLRSSRMLPGQEWASRARSFGAMSAPAGRRGGRTRRGTRWPVGDDLDSLAQRGQVEGDNIQPVKQVGAEPAGGDLLVQRAVAGHDQPGLQRLGLVRPDRLEDPLLDRPQQLGLQPGGRESISSRNRVPCPTSANLPTRSASAPVKAPLTWPNISLSIRLADRAPQLIVRNGFRAGERAGGSRRPAGSCLCRSRRPGGSWCPVGRSGGSARSSPPSAR